MAIGKERPNTGNGFKLYTGIDNFHVLGVNPDLQTLNAWGVAAKKEPEYTFIDDNGTKGIRIVFWLKSTTVEDFITSVTFRLYNKKMQGENNGVMRTAMIDAYGNVEWLDDNQIKNHIVPLTKKGKKAPFFANNMRPARRGEGELMQFIRCWLNLSDAFRYKNEVWQLIDKADTYATCRFDTIGDFFAGNVDEIRNCMCERTVKLLCGVRSGKDGLMHQEVYPDLVFRADSNKAKDGFSEEIGRRKSKGYLRSSEYTFEGLQEWNVVSKDDDEKPEEQPEEKTEENPDMA